MKICMLVGLFCLTLSHGIAALVSAESYMVRGSYFVNAGTPTQIGPFYLVTGNANLTVPGFNRNGTLQSVEKRYKSDFSFGIQCLTDFGGAVATAGQGFLSPSYQVADYAGFNTILQQISTFGGFFSNGPYICQSVGQILSSAGSIMPGGFTLAPQAQPATLLDFTTAGSVPIQTWLGFSAAGQLPLPGTASGTFYVIYNYLPGALKSLTLGNTDSTKDKYIIGTDVQNEAEYKALQKHQDQARKKAMECKDRSDAIQTTLPLPGDDFPSPSVNIKTTLREKVSGIQQLISGFGEYLKWGAKTDYLGCASVLNKYAADPPDSNYLELVERSPDEVEMGFSAKFGPQYANLDEAFKKFAIGLESWQLFVTSLERMQGAVLANDTAAANIQKARAIELINEGDAALTEASVAFVRGAFDFISDDQGLIDLALQMGEVAADITPSALLEAASSSVPQLACTGPSSPFDKPLILKNKSNPTIPVKIVLKDSNGSVMTDLDITSPPRISVIFNSTELPSDSIEVDDVVSTGKANADNLFRFDLLSEEWIYNLGTKQFPAPGTYTVKVLSGDETKYTFNGNCTQTFQRMP